MVLTIYSFPNSLYKSSNIIIIWQNIIYKVIIFCTEIGFFFNCTSDFFFGNIVHSKHNSFLFNDFQAQPLIFFHPSYNFPIECCLCSQSLVFLSFYCNKVIIIGRMPHDQLCLQRKKPKFIHPFSIKLFTFFSEIFFSMYENYFQDTIHW